jgi:hypothetical protein
MANSEEKYVCFPRVIFIITNLNIRINIHEEML